MKFIPYEKLSKKKQRELDAVKRGSWGSTNPATRTARTDAAKRPTRAMLKQALRQAW